jgi:hypothetical protein
MQRKGESEEFLWSASSFSHSLIAPAVGPKASRSRTQNPNNH